MSPDEAHLYNKAQEQNINKIDTADDLQKYVKLTEQLTNTVNMDYKTTRIKYSGLLNPFQLGYSARNGITYKQRFRISKTFTRDKQIRFRPEIGYVFKRKQIFFKVGGDWEYSPQKRGILSVEVGNSNESYSSETEGKMTVNLWYPVMKNGVIKFPRPEECPVHKPVRNMKMKKFGETENNFTGLGEFREVT